MLSCDGGFLPTDECKYSIFFTINALLEYYFFNYKEISSFEKGEICSIIHNIRNVQNSVLL